MRRVATAKKKAWAIFLGSLFVLAVIGLLRRGASTEVRRISIIPRENSSVYWEKFRLGAMKACEEEGLEMVWNGPEIESDGRAQIQAVEQALAERVSGIVLAPSDSKVIAGAIKRICDEEIPCVIVDSDIATDQYPSLLTINRKKGGELAAKRFGEILNGSGKVIVVRWTANSPSTNVRTAAFKETMARDFPDIEVVDSNYCDSPTVDKAKIAAENMLAGHADASGIFACNATTAAGVLQALRNPENVGRNIRMVGFDAWPLLVAALENHEIDSLIVLDPHKLGYEAVKAIATILSGGKVPKEVDPGVELVTPERLAERKIKTLLNLQ